MFMKLLFTTIIFLATQRKNFDSKIVMYIFVKLKLDRQKKTVREADREAEQIDLLIAEYYDSHIDGGRKGGSKRERGGRGNKGKKENRERERE